MKPLKTGTQLIKTLAHSRVDRKGRAGTRVILDFKLDDGYDGTYHIETHGMTDAEVTAKIDEIADHHQAKSDRLVGMQGIPRRIVTGGETFYVTFCSILDRPGGVELYASLNHNGNELVVVTMLYATVGDVPSDREIERMLRDAARDEVAKMRAAEDELARVARLLA